MGFVPPEFPDDFNMADYFVFSNLEAGRGEETAIYFEGLAICYREVAEKVMRVARNLVADGLLPEQRVLVCMQDRPQFAFIDEQSLPQFWKALANSRHCGGGENLIVVGDLAAGRRRFDDWIARETKAEPWPTRKDDPAVWLFTSGTTGKSKGAVHPH